MSDLALKIAMATAAAERLAEYVSAHDVEFTTWKTTRETFECVTDLPDGGKMNATVSRSKDVADSISVAYPGDIEPTIEIGHYRSKFQIRLGHHGYALEPQLEIPTLSNLVRQLQETAAEKSFVLSSVSRAPKP